MKNYIVLTGSILFLTIIKASCLYSQQESKDSVQWDHRMINEADIWYNLLDKYYYADHSLYWPSRKQSISKVIVQFPNSQWADDAALMMACDQAVQENNLEDGISALRQVITDYPTASTIISGWDPQSGGRISNAWLMWAPPLVSYKQDTTIAVTFPFDKNYRISILEREALAYFAHLEEHPNLTKDVAGYIIASMLFTQGDVSGAINELESLLIPTHELSALRSVDYKAALTQYGYLLGCEPPNNIRPVWRVQYAAYMLLIELYQFENQNEKAMQLSLDLAASCSPDGWYWIFNRYAGNICSQNGEFSLAAEQYELALKGIKKTIEIKSERLSLLYEHGNMIKRSDFVSWDEAALKPFAAIIDEIEGLLNQARLQ